MACRARVVDLDLLVYNHVVGVEWYTAGTCLRTTVSSP